MVMTMGKEYMSCNVVACSVVAYETKLRKYSLSILKTKYMNMKIEWTLFSFSEIYE